MAQLSPRMVALGTARSEIREAFAFAQARAAQVGPEKVDELVREGYLTEKCATGEKEHLSAFATVARQQIVFDKMKEMILEYFEMWYV